MPDSPSLAAAGLLVIIEDALDLRELLQAAFHARQLLVALALQAVVAELLAIVLGAASHYSSARMHTCTRTFCKCHTCSPELRHPRGQLPPRREL